MSGKWQTAHVFISSTFRDMHAERDYLVKVVFPELRERLETHSIHLVDIDWRWGVTAEQVEHHQALDLCLMQINDCQPFFIGLLGERYGWVPPTGSPPRRRKRGEMAGTGGKSITAMEIVHGVLRHPAVIKKAFFYFRSPAFLREVPPSKRGEVEAETPEATRKLVQLKDEIRRALLSKPPMEAYPCRYAGLRLDWELLREELSPADRAKLEAVARDNIVEPNEYERLEPHLRTIIDKHGVVYVDGLEEFGNRVRDDLWEAFCREYPRLNQEPPPVIAGLEKPEVWLEREQYFHEQFVESRTRVYVGRRRIHAALLTYLESDSTRPLLLVGGAGCGKSAILARLHETCQQEHSEPILVSHFVGVSPSSTDLDRMLQRFCRILDREFEFDLDSLEEPGTLAGIFGELLKKIPDDRRAIFLIDGVNQLDELGGAHEMAWLPMQLPSHVKIVVSCIEEKGKEQPALVALRNWRTPEIRIGPLTLRECLGIVREVPLLSAKTLDRDQRRLMLENPATANPLFLRVALEELRGYGSFARLNARIRSLPRVTGEESLTALFDQVLERLEGDVGQSLVGSALCLIASSRTGLADRELAEILGPLLRAGDALPSGRLPVMLRQLRPYLMRRDEFTDFYHRSLWKAVQQRYLADPERRQDFHRKLAVYFLGKGRTSPRMLSETIYHMHVAEMWGEIEELLTDLEFVRAKCRAGMTSELVNDYVRVEAGWPGEERTRQGEEERRQQLEWYAQRILAYARKWSEARDRHAADPAGFPMPGAGDIPLPPPPLSVEIQSTDRPAASDEGAWTPLERIKSWHHFVANYTSFMARPEVSLFQLAYNSSCGGPVARSAERQLAHGQFPARPWLRLINRPSYTPYPACLATLEGHHYPVWAVAVTPDGRRVFSGSHDRTVQLWDVETGTCLKVLQHGTLVNAVAITPDGLRALTGGNDGLVRVWDLESGRCLAELAGHQGKVNSLAMTPDGRWTLSGSDDRTLRLWDSKRGACGKVLEGQANPVRTVAMTPDGRWAISGCGDPALRVWNLETGRCWKTLEGHPDCVNAVAMTPDGRWALVAGGVYGRPDYAIRLLDLEAGECRQSMAGHMTEVWAVAMTADGRWAASGGWEDTVRIWDLKSGRCVKILEGHAREVTAVAMTPDGSRVVSGSWDHAVRVWRPETGQSPKSWEGHTNWVYELVVLGGGQRLVSGSYDKTVRLWDLQEGTCVKTLAEHKDGLHAVAVTPDQRRLITGSFDRMAYVWDFQTGQMLRTLKGHSSWVQRVTVTPDGRWMVTASRDKALRVWDAETGECRKALEGHKDRVETVAVTPDGRQAISGGWDSTLRRWDLASGRQVEIRTVPVEAVIVTRDGRRALSGSWDGIVRVWDLRTGECLKTLKGHTDWVTTVVETIDGRRAISGNTDKTVRVWDLEADRCLATHVSPGGNIWSVVAHGPHVAAGSTSGRIDFLRFENGPLMGPAIVTAVYSWRPGTAPAAGEWDDRLTVLCPWCGQILEPAGPVRDAINGIARDASLAPDQAPCLTLPDEAWEEEGLWSDCPHCRGKLKFNPFVCNNRYLVIR